MSLNKEQLKQHCLTIIKSPRIRNKIVVLCEGDISNMQARLSPSSYRQMEKMPDSNFYKACVPRWWSQYRPQFFNCGDRKDVIDSYFNLLDLNNSHENSYLEPAKLFAIIDLDLQSQEISNYPFSDTEEIFCNLYEGMDVNETNAANHRIWVTGLIHKEAYFLLPDLQDMVFNKLPVPMIHNHSPLLLEDIYIAMSDSISDDADLQNNFQRACSRIN